MRCADLQAIRRELLACRRGAACTSYTSYMYYSMLSVSSHASRTPEVHAFGIMHCVLKAARQQHQLVDIFRVTVHVLLAEQLQVTHVVIKAMAQPGTAYKIIQWKSGRRCWN